MISAEKARLIAEGVMDDWDDAYPRICECCGKEHRWGTDAAKRAGWKLGCDGWVCKKCDTPNE